MMADRAKPKTVTPDAERADLVDFQRQVFCDTVIQRAVDLMTLSGAPADLVAERLLTHMTAFAASTTQPPLLAAAFRAHLADVESGVFHKAVAENGRQP